METWKCQFPSCDRKFCRSHPHPCLAPCTHPTLQSSLLCAFSYLGYLLDFLLWLCKVRVLVIAFICFCFCFKKKSQPDRTDEIIGFPGCLRSLRCLRWLRCTHCKYTTSVEATDSPDSSHSLMCCTDISLSTIHRAEHIRTVGKSQTILGLNLTGEKPQYDIQI